MDVASFCVIREHITYFFLSESCHLVEGVAQSVIGADIESARQVSMVTGATPVTNTRSMEESVPALMVSKKVRKYPVSCVSER